MNLSENRARDVQQQEQIGRRTSIIAERRDTRAPALETAASLRTARRGDVGGAEALLRTLGLVERAGGDVVSYMQNKNALDEKDNIAKGFADEAVGTVDDEMMQKSLGYRNAVTKGRTVTNFTEATREFDDELKELIEGQDSPDLEERLTEVNTRIEQFYESFAKDPETGELRDYLQSPGAMRYLAEAIQTSRPRAQAAAQQMVEDGFKREATALMGKNIVDQAIETGTIDLVAARSLLPDLVTDEEFAAAVMVSGQNAARALEKAGRFEEATALLAGLTGRATARLNTGVGQSQPTGTAGASGSLPSSGAPGQFVTAFRGTGLSDAVIAGFLGNLEHESNFDSARVGDSGSAFGHVQWRGERAENFRRIIGVDPKGASPEQSVQFIKWELDNYREAGMTKKQRDAILNAETPEEAARAIDRFYERSDQKSTRDRMSAARRYFGEAVAQEAPAAAAAETPPALRLTDPFATPVTLTEQLGTTAAIPGIEDVQFSPEQQAQLDALYEQSTARMDRAWRQRRAEEQSVNSSRLALGMLGLDGVVTTPGDIESAYRNDEIGADDLQALLTLNERREDRRQADLDREESRAEREEARRQRRETKAGMEGVLGMMFTGQMNPAQARSSALQIAASITDPEVSADVLSGIVSAANALESTIQNSEPVRKQMQRFEEDVDTSSATLSTLVPDLPRGRVAAFAPQHKAIIERTAGRYMQEVLAGTDPEVAAINAQTYRTEQENQLIAAIRTPR